MPFSWWSWYLPVKARSVPCLRSTLNCSGVSCSFHSSSVFSTFWMVAVFPFTAGRPFAAVFRGAA